MSNTLHFQESVECLRKKKEYLSTTQKICLSLKQEKLSKAISEPKHYANVAKKSKSTTPG